MQERVHFLLLCNLLRDQLYNQDYRMYGFHETKYPDLLQLSLTEVCIHILFTVITNLCCRAKIMHALFNLTCSTIQEAWWGGNSHVMESDWWKISCESIDAVWRTGHGDCRSESDWHISVWLRHYMSFIRERVGMWIAWWRHVHVSWGGCTTP